MKAFRKSKPFKKYLWMGCGVVVMAYFGVSHYRAEQEKIIRAAEAKAAQSISVLPEGVEESWMNYVDKRLAEEIQREGRNLRVRTTYIGISPSYSYVSLNYPYQIDCNDDFNFGISVYFGTDEDNSISAHITGLFSPDHKNEQDQDVPRRSIASKNLDEKLCKLVAQRVAEIISEQPIQPQ